MFPAVQADSFSHLQGLRGTVGGVCVCKWVLLVIHEVLPRDAFMVLPSVAAWHLPGGYHVVQLLGAPSSGFSVKDAPAVFLRSFLTSE